MINVYYLKTIDENLKCCLGGVETKELMSENVFVWFLGQFYITYLKIKKFHQHNSEIWFFDILMSYILLPERMWWGRIVLHVHNEVWAHHEYESPKFNFCFFFSFDWNCLYMFLMTKEAILHHYFVDEKLALLLSRSYRKMLHKYSKNCSLRTVCPIDLVSSAKF